MIRDSLRNLLPENWKISTRLRRDPRALMRRSLLRILAVAHDQRLDNATLISNLADEHRGSNRRLLRRLARRIDGGLPLVAALEQTPDVLSDHQVLAIRYGSQSGTLPATYQSLIIQEQNQALTASGDLRQTAIYLATMGFILLWIVSFLMTFIYPTIEKMLSEFGVETPWVYGLVTRTYHQLGPAALLLLYGSIFAIPLLWASPLGRWLRRRAADSRLHWVQQLRIAELLELLAQSVEAGLLLSLTVYQFLTQLVFQLR